MAANQDWQAVSQYSISRLIRTTATKVAIWSAGSAMSKKAFPEMLHCAIAVTTSVVHVTGLGKPSCVGTDAHWHRVDRPFAGVPQVQCDLLSANRGSWSLVKVVPS